MDILKNILSQEIIQNLGWTLVHFVWQAAAIALLLAIVLRLLHKSSANLRYIIACMALALIVLMPIVTIRMVDVSVETIEPVKLVSVDLPKAEFDAPALVQMPQLQSPPTQAAVTPSVSLKDRFIETVEPSLPFIVVGWLVGVFGLSIWHLGGWAQLQRLRRKMVKQVGERVNLRLRHLAQKLGIKQAVEIAESALVQVPAVVGWLRPVILLPASALTGLSGQQLEAILAHELAHIKRCDYLVNMLQTAVEILGFYHPAVWWVSHKIRAERENCCDDLAVGVSGDRVAYARALTSLEEVRAGYTLAVAADGGGLFERIRRLLAKDHANEAKPSWLPSVIAIMLIGSLLIPVCFALSSQSFSDTMKEKEFKTVTLAVVDEDSLDKVDSTMISVFDFSTEKIIDITVDLKGLSEREKGSRFFNTIFATKADLLIENDGEIVVLGPSTAKFKGTSLKEISKIGAKRLAAHIRAEERRRPSEFIDIPFWNGWLSPDEVGAFLTEDGFVVAIQAGEFIAGSKKGEFKYIVVGHVDPQNLPEPKLLEKVVVRNKLLSVLEYPAYIKNVAKGLFEKIQNADYDFFLNSQNPEAWKEFPIVKSYKAYKEYPELVRWICKTFRGNPIVSIELGEVAASQNDWPGIGYKLILQDGSTIEGNLRFEYHFFDDLNGRWYGIHGLDWHLQDEPIKKPNLKTDVQIEVEKPIVQAKFEKLSKVLKTKMVTVRVYNWNASILGQYIGCNLTRFDNDYIFLKSLGLTVRASPEEVFEKQGQCAFYMKPDREFVPVRGTVIAPLSLPYRVPESPNWTVADRLELMSKKQIIDQMKDNLGGSFVSRPVKLKQWISYGIITPEGNLIVMFDSDLGGLKGPTLIFFDLGKTATGTDENEGDIVKAARLRDEELRQRMEAAKKLSDLGKASR
jgi:beta-lactamase regulating signal transducer with metallopeptidase domain